MSSGFAKNEILGVLRVVGKSTKQTNTLPAVSPRISQMTLINEDLCVTDMKNSF